MAMPRRCQLGTFLAILPTVPRDKSHASSHAGAKFTSSAGVETPLVVLADGTLFPEWAEIYVYVDADETMTPVRVEVEVRDGRPIVTGVSIIQFGRSSSDRIALTPTNVRNLNFGEIFDEAVRVGGYMGVGYQNPKRDKPAAIAAAKRATALARRRQPLLDARLKDVAEIVAKNKYDPRKEIASSLHVSDRTASRWIAEAKRRGLVADLGTDDG
jgi:hypothetical protein